MHPGCLMQAILRVPGVSELFIDVALGQGKSLDQHACAQRLTLAVLDTRMLDAPGDQFRLIGN